MNNQTTLLLEKLIDLTKNNAIEWNVYSQSPILLNKNDNSFLGSNLSEMIISPHSFAIHEKSYIAHYKNGIIALIAYTCITSGNYVELLIQPDLSSNAQCLASSNDDTLENQTLIKRLYNLVDCVANSPNLNAFINDIINAQ